MISSGQARIVVTGCAGFLGSHLTEHLLALGHDVLGIDSYTDFYPRWLKARNIARCLQQERFTLAELELSTDDLDDALDGADIVFHLAARAGVRGSFGESFATYLRENVLATQRLLESAARRPPQRLVYASSSSVYGDAPCYPTPESAPSRAVSPYGMTKMATEALAAVYRHTHGIPVVGLRFFTAYGPRQRPDMAFSRFISRALAGEPLHILGDGQQTRDFTYVDDIIAGTVAAAEHGRPGAVYNLGSGRPVMLLTVIEILERLLDRKIQVVHARPPVGEARVTAADISLALADLGYTPAYSLERGLAAQLDWARSLSAVSGEARAVTPHELLAAALVA